MDYIDGSGFWLHSLGDTPVTPTPPTTAVCDYIPTWRPRRRAWWWIVLPWLWGTTT